MNKLMIAVATVAVSLGAFAFPHGGHHGGRFHHPPAHHWHHHGGYWGPGGRYFWPGFVGGVVGGVVYNSLAYPYCRDTVVVQTAPTVVTQPVVVQQPVVTAAPVQQIRTVWVEGRYVDQQQPNGTVVRTWQPGHYEQQTVVGQ